VIGTTLNQRFTLDKELGRGGMGAVYRATDLVLGRPVAIKVLKEHTGDEVGGRIRLEAQILARLVHEHIVRIYDFGEAEGLYYFVMEEVDGSSFFRRAKVLDLAAKLRILAQVADALDYAHHQGVIHRDVKPANVLLTKSDSARLSDFGLSVLMEADSQDSGILRGTPTYMSPEQAKGKRLDHRTDLYSLGVMLYECATGSTPFSGPPYAVIASHANAAPDPPRSRNPEVPAAVEGLILRLMAKSPDARPTSGAAVAELIRDLLTTRPALGVAAVPRGERPPAASVPRVEGESTAATMIVDPSDSLGATPAGVAAATPPSGSVPEVQKALAERMIADVVADPVTLTPDERYLAGHYLAYLLGGSRRRGFLRRRPLDPLNADRARLLLALTWLTIRGSTDEAFASAAELLESRPDVRPKLSPVVVAKYLAARDTPPKRKALRAVRRKLQESSTYAREHLTDEKGVLNPGLMPQVLDDLRKIAPGRTEVDDQLVERWNRVADVWRDRPDFRQAVLSYATTKAGRDPASALLWPEVVYPLIERALWQRRLRSGPEVVWDQVLKALHVPEPGNQFDRAVQTVVPRRVVEEIDADVADFLADEPDVDAFADAAAPADPEERLAAGMAASSLYEMSIDQAPSRGLVRLANPDPVRLTQGELHGMWQEAIAAMRTPSKAGLKHLPLGPYRLAVIPSIRGRSAGQVAIQGMRGNKQIEMLTPSLRVAGTASKPIVAAWVYTDDSLAIAYVDFQNVVRYITWHAPTGHQDTFDDPADLNHALFSRGLEVPDSLDVALTKRFRPRNPV
jgi:hypothetical protein